MPSLAASLREEIERSGPMPFRRFMERALYAPEGGYYASGRAAIGRRGDFVTSVSVGSLFGRLLAVQFEQMWRNLGCPACFQLVEQGANGGDFAADVLTAAQAWPEFDAALRYHIVEPFPINIERQRARLAASFVDLVGRVTWHASLEALPAFTGVHFSNELVDAFPVEAVVFRDGAWRQRCVTWTGTGFGWADRPLADPQVAQMLTHAPRLEGYETEVNPGALSWLATVARRLERGYLLAADYGFARADYYLPERREGTLSSYREQRRCADLLADPGEQDLTAHVDFTALAEAGLNHGFALAGFTDQHHFMAALGKSVFPDITDPAELTPARQKAMREFAMLMHPSLMGLGFQYLALAKDAPGPLLGFEFARDVAAFLGIAR